jgi:ornithine decarboxylase
MAVRPAAQNPQSVPAPETEQSQLFDTHPEVRLDFKHVRKSLKQGYTRPFLLVDTGIVRTKVRRFKAAMPRVNPHYAVKANPDPRVLKVLIEEGTGFEIASIAELDLLL